MPFYLDERTHHELSEYIKENSSDEYIGMYFDLMDLIRRYDSDSPIADNDYYLINRILVEYEGRTSILYYLLADFLVKKGIVDPVEVKRRVDNLRRAKREMIPNTFLKNNC